MGWKLPNTSEDQRCPFCFRGVLYSDLISGVSSIFLVFSFRNAVTLDHHMTFSGRENYRITE